jgi:hypothetical protein
VRRTPPVSFQASDSAKVPWANTAFDSSVRFGWMKDMAHAVSVGSVGVTTIGPRPRTEAGWREMSMSKRIALSSSIMKAPTSHWKRACRAT